MHVSTPTAETEVNDSALVAANKFQAIARCFLFYQLINLPAPTKDI
jgi:hypothetical protein